MALKGVKVIELAGLAPAPFCGLILSDFGASVIRVAKTEDSSYSPDFLVRGKQSIAVDLKHEKGQQIIKHLCRKADVLIEPFRPGVMEKLKLGPQQLFAENDALIYARLSGFGQNGPLKNEAGHDINYLAISGVLSILGNKSVPPSPPINLLGDFAGGGLICALGISFALLERYKSGKGQVIDANIVEGTSYVSSWLWHSMKKGNPFSEIVWPQPQHRESNLLDGGSPMYSVYETKDNKYMAVGSLEPQFYSNLLRLLNLDPLEYSQFDVEKFNKIKQKFTEIFKSKSQREWIDIFAGQDACVAPVVDISDAKDYRHNKDRGSFLSDGTPRPAPCLSRTPAIPSLREPKFNEDTKSVLKELEYSEEEIDALMKEKVISVNTVQSKL